jgi:hypothetical protein
MTQDIPAVGQREPCPCGSGKRYKNCHGRERDTDVFVARPFEGIKGEAELVAMLELLASATCDVKLLAHPDVPKRMKATLVTVLPGGSAALRTDENSVLVALQTQLHSSDRSADIARSIITASAAPIGEFIAATSSSKRDVRAQDLIDTSATLTPQVQPTFQWWHDLGVADPEIADDREAVTDMNESIMPVSRIGDAAFFVEMAERTQVRSVLSEAETLATDAFARLVAAGDEGLGEGSRWLGNFRTCGLLAPVWDVPDNWGADEARAAYAAFTKRYQAAVQSTEPLTSAQRQSRATVVGKFVTLR